MASESTPITNPQKPVVVHMVYRLGTGGLERVLADTVAGLNDFQHVIISLTDKTDFAQRLPDNISIYELNKQPGKDLGHYLRLWKRLRKIKPALLHTYNIATLEYQLVGKLAGIKAGIHAEHGRDIYDTDGTHSRYNRLRRWFKPLVKRFVPVSEDLAVWLREDLGFEAEKVTRIYNGIDTKHYVPIDPAEDGTFTLTTVARLSPIKDQATLLQAYGLFLQRYSGQSRLQLVGDGPERATLEALVSELGIAKNVEFAGEQHNVLPYLQACDLFVLSSIAEGIPMTVLEAMACGKPIVATQVGGLPELVEAGRNGLLVSAQNPEAMAAAWLNYAENRQRCRQEGDKSRQVVVEHFSLEQMLSQYQALYTKVIA